jgi:hypothetical protein
LLAALRKLGKVSSPVEDKLTVDADAADLEAFIQEHGAVYRAFRPQVIALVLGESEIAAQSDAALREEWTAIGNGAERVMEMMGGGVHPVPVAQATVTAAADPELLQSLPPPPMTASGYPYIDARGFEWMARRQQGSREPPPYQWIFGNGGRF